MDFLLPFRGFGCMLEASRTLAGLLALLAVGGQMEQVVIENPVINSPFEEQ
jgi:hypothetical protein